MSSFLTLFVKLFIPEFSVGISKYFFAGFTALPKCFQLLDGAQQHFTVLSQNLCTFAGKDWRVTNFHCF